MVCSLAVVVAAVAVGCTSGYEPETGGALPEDAAIDYIFATDTLTDWLVSGDGVAVVDVIRTERGQGSAGIGPVWVPRYVMATVRERLWRRPGSERVPDRLRIEVFGYRLHDGREHIEHYRGHPWLETGDRALMVLVRSPEGWGMLHPKAVAPVVAGRVRPVAGAPKAATARLEGLTPAGVRQLLRRQRLTPAQLERQRLTDPLKRAGWGMPFDYGNGAARDRGDGPARRL